MKTFVCDFMYNRYVNGSIMLKIRINQFSNIKPKIYVQRFRYS